MRRGGVPVIISTALLASAASTAVLVGSTQRPLPAAIHVAGPRPVKLVAPVSAENSTHWTTYRNAQLSLKFPAGWHVGPRMMGGSFSIPVFSVSKQPVGNTCKTTKVKGGSVTQCGLPIRSLQRDGVFLTWSAAASLPRRSQNLPPGRRLTVDGRPASLKIEAAASGVRRYGVLIEHGHPVNIQAFNPPSGPRVWARKLVTVTVKRTTLNNRYVMTAMLRGPHFPRSLAQIMKIVHSTTFRYP